MNSDKLSFETGLLKAMKWNLYPRRLLRLPQRQDARGDNVFRLEQTECGGG